MEVTWEALENAGINPLSLKESPTGVFIGITNTDYLSLIYKLEPEYIGAYAGSGNAISALAGRLSYFFGFQGPCLATDTACSSSLVALNTACKSIQNGECKLAVAGGVSLMFNPDVTIIECQSHMLAKDGYCKTFDKEADGYTRGEGCGIVILKRLSEAIRDHDNVVGIVRATAVNENGPSSGLTVPNKEAQAALIRTALARAQLDPTTIDYIEAHGTGTSLGDPIEIGALIDVFGGRKESPLSIGSVKTNIGHLEAAAGIAGMIKTLLALNYEAIPPHLHLKELNPLISLDAIPAKLPLTLTSWPRSNRRRIAGVSSFGFSGINAHAIIEEPPILEMKQNGVDRPWHLLTLSAKTPAALDQLIDLYIQQLPEENFADIAFTANTGRAHFAHRAAILAQTKEEFLDHLKTGNFLLGQIPAKPPKMTFIFTGKEMENLELEIAPIFKEAMEKSQGLYEYALAELWKSWGIVPDYVAGEGKGEMIAAIVAGIITLEEGLKLIAADEQDPQINYRAPQISFISSWTGQVIRQEGMTADYWKPHEPIRNIPEDTLVIYPQHHWKNLLQTLAELYLKGIPIDWASFDKSYARKKVTLPNYPFQRERYWLEALTSKKKPHFAREAHPLLGEAIPMPTEEKLFRNEMDLDFLPFLKDHQVFDTILFPGAGFVELLHAAGVKLFDDQTFTIDHLIIEQPLALDKSMPIELFAQPEDDGYTASIYSIHEKNLVLHAKAALQATSPLTASPLDWEGLRTLCQQPIDIIDLYKKYDALGLHYGQSFQTIRKIWTGDKEFIAEVEGEASPALLDGCLQTLAITIKEQFESGASVYLPYEIDHLICYAELGKSVRIHGKLVQSTDTSITADLEIFSYSGNRIMTIEGFHARKTDRSHLKQLLSKQTGVETSAWFYQFSWQPKALEKIKGELKGLWWIVSEDAQEGIEAKRIKPEQAVSELGENIPEHVLWFLAGQNSLKDILEFVQTIEKLEKKPQLFFITQGIQPIGPITDLDHATFNGFFKTLKLEIPSLNTRHIDLVPHEKWPLEELLADDSEDQVAYRQGIRYVPRLVKEIKPVEKTLEMDTKGSYLITGGLGALGLLCAKWLVEKGAKHLVLMGRRASPSIEIPGAVIETAAVDVSDSAAVDALIQKYGNDWPELKGVIHTAGVLDDGILSSQNWSRFEKVFAPKVQGSWNLHASTLNKPLDFFILFSSVASSLGSPGQINYASANSYMDALAYYRQDKGLPALSISWGPWSEVGLAAKLTERHRASGFIAIKPQEGVKAFELALTQANPHVSIAHIDWKKVSFKQAFLSEQVGFKGVEAAMLFQHLSDALPSERKDILTEYLQKTAGKILGVKELNSEQGFFDSGMDSLMAKELQTKLQLDMGDLHTFPSTLTFDYPSISKLSQYFEEKVFPLLGIKTAIIQKVAPVKEVIESADQIAVIGLSCRFPGGANSPQAFWESLKQGYDGISEIPADRWDIEAFYDPKPDTPGKMYVRRAGFLSAKPDTFDADFFGISPREAEYMDPQQRLILEVTWEALENSGINPLSLKGSSTGVFIGITNADYVSLIYKLEPENMGAYTGTGNAFSALAGRLSYFFGFQGPCLAVDTACSSSLVALNSACKSIQDGECNLAVVGGVSLMFNPEISIFECQAHMLAKDGYCKTFDREADGYARGEGCGTVILKRLSDAIRDQDPIVGIIRTTAVNENGASSGLTVPNKEAQAALIRKALARAELDPTAIDYIEAHGTGTSLGDPIEIGALIDVFGGRKESPLSIGSVKTNIGHLEAAAGIAGMIKTLLALNYEAIPPHLHLKELNPLISLDAIPAKIPLTLTSWPRSNRRRIAGVSSFGFSGINAHAIIEESPILEMKQNGVDRPWHLLTLSAKTQTALDQLIDLYSKQLPEENFADIAFTANTGRAHFAHRAIILAQTKEECLDHLKTGHFLLGQIPAKLSKITFFFTGKEMENFELETSPIFKEAMERSQGLYEYALSELWKSWGIVPDYVAGEGKGEMIAAIVAGIITLEEGLKLIAADEQDPQINYRSPQIRFISSWTGQVIRQEGMTADYWKPHEPIRNIPEDTLVIYPQHHWKNLLQTLAELYLKGIPIDWASFDKSYARKKVTLPNYPFQRERYWLEALTSKKKTHFAREAHPLLGEAIPMPTEEKLFRNEMDLDFLPFLKDHQVFDTILFPGAGFVELLHAAGVKLFDDQTFTIDHLIIEQPLALDKSMPIELFAQPEDDGYTASIYSIHEKNLVLHAKAALQADTSLPASKLDWEGLRTLCQKPIDIADLYKKYDSLGLHYGKSFQTIRKIWAGDKELIAELEGEASPALLDGCLQTLAITIKEQFESEEAVYLPYEIDHLICYSELGTSVRIHGRLVESTDTSITADLEIFSYSGNRIMKIEGFHARKTDLSHLKQLLSKQTAVETSSWFYQISWQPKAVEKIKEEQKGSWWIVSEDTQDIEGLDAKRLKPEQAVSEKGENIAEHVLWFVRGQNSLKYILEFVQTLEKLEKKPQLFFITQGIQPIGPMADLDNATFNGFFKTLKLEMPSLNTRHIDLALNEKWPPEELLADDSEDQVAYRQGIRYVPRFVYEKEIAKQVEKTIEIDPKGSYLITGGLGALGLLCAKWLVEKGAKHLVLIGRRASPSIEIPGAIVETAPLDVSDRVAVEALIQNFGRNWPELKGVLHTAGVLDDGILASQNWSRFEKVFAPKVQGSWNLHESTLNKPLDFFILFSSVASSLGSPGQINYSSANSYMDALAYYRHDKGLPALSISWGPWSEVA